jgi:hypothetical protein
MFTVLPRFRLLGGLAAAVLGAGILLFGGRCVREGTAGAGAESAAVRLRVENYADAAWTLEFRGEGQTVVYGVGPRERKEVRFAPGSYRVTQALRSTPEEGGTRVFATRFEAGGSYRWALLTARSEPAP